MFNENNLEIFEIKFVLLFQFICILMIYCHLLTILFSALIITTSVLTDEPIWYLWTLTILICLFFLFEDIWIRGFKTKPRWQATNAMNFHCGKWIENRFLAYRTQNACQTSTCRQINHLALLFYRNFIKNVLKQTVKNSIYFKMLIQLWLYSYM